MTETATCQRPPLFRPVKRFRSDQSGLAATEFALMVPVLLLILMGIIEFSNALSVKRKLLNSVQTTADLIAQQTDVTAADLDTFFLGGQLALAPFDTTKLTLGVASVRYDDDTGDPYLDWTDSYNGGSVFEPLVKAAGHGSAGDSIIIVSGAYAYSPLVSLIIPTDITMSELTYMRPRTVSYIIKN